MKILLQRVTRAKVEVNSETVACIGHGLLALVGFGRHDEPDLPKKDAWRAMQRKMVELRIFPDEQDKLNLDLGQYRPEGADQPGGELLLVSQFTLYADCRKGRRPSFTSAAPPDTARALYDRFVADMKELLPNKVQSGVFGAEMAVSLVNWGPVTIELDSNLFGS